MDCKGGAHEQSYSGITTSGETKRNRLTVELCRNLKKRLIRTLKKREIESELRDNTNENKRRQNYLADRVQKDDDNQNVHRVEIFAVINLIVPRGIVRPCTVNRQ